MKYFYTLLIIGFSRMLLADPGDTTIVQAFTFGSVQDSIITFPDDNKEYERVLMHYTLRCIPGGAGGLEYPCGEWDYLTYTYLYEPTGKMDSIRLYQPSFLVDKDTIGQFEYQEEALFDRYFRSYPVEIAQDLSMEQTATLGSPGDEVPYLNQVGESSMQLILSSAQLGNLLSDGDNNIYGLAFETVADIEARALEELVVEVENKNVRNINEWQTLDNATTCFRAPFVFEGSGLQRIHFLTDQLPTWDGQSDMVFHLKWKNKSSEPIVLVSDAESNLAMMQSNDDGYLEFEDADRLVVANASELFAEPQQEITISFWNYGDPQQNPKNSSIIEARDKSGQRILNIHLPWGNNRIYWDAGKNANENAYDRIEKLASNSQFEGRWNHWAFTKNAASGTMKIYLNGNLWHEGSNKSYPIEGIEDFYIGSMVNGNFYRGKLDELRIWNKSLTRSQIQEWMNRSIDDTHPEYEHLQLYYDFNGDGYMENNLANALGTGEFYGIPDREKKSAEDIRFNVAKLSEAPLVHFLMNGNYDYRRDAIGREDTIFREPVALEVFSNNDDPEQRTSLSYVWVPDTTYFYFDDMSTVNQVPEISAVLDLSIKPYYSEPFEIIERFELGRYITPYGIGLDLGEGWTWIYDVTDYLPLLKGEKRLTAGNWQEWLDLKFLFIEGTPDREVKRIQNVHSGTYEYRSSADANQKLENKTMGFLPDTEMAKLKVRNSGHGFGGTLNCSEFCPRNNRIMVNNQLAFEEYFWRDDCGLNPLKGQGGTWVYNRAGWCPGDKVNAYEYELTDLIDFGDSVQIDYHLQDGYNWNGQGTLPAYQIENQLVEYGPLNHAVDLRIEEVIAPNVEEIYGNENPTCGQPIVRVRNTGAENIKTITFNYGIQGGLTRNYELTDLDLSFDEIATYELPPLTNGTWPESDNQRFFVEIDLVNGATDDYTPNNRIVSNYVPPRRLNAEYDGFFVTVRTNNNGDETSYRLKDAAGNVLLERSNLASNTTYYDTFYVDSGCYEFEIKDAGNDGLEWWANRDQGSGLASIRGLFRGFGVAFLGIDPDFGSAYKLNFSVGEVVSNEEEQTNQWGFNIIPNPASDFVGISMQGFHPEGLQIEIRDQLGRMVHSEERPFDGLILLDQLQLPQGIYWLSVHQGDHSATKKLVVVR